MSSEPWNFSWLIENEIAGSAQPESLQELRWISQQQNIHHILNLGTSFVYEEILKHLAKGAEAVGIKLKVISVEEFDEPSREATLEIMEYFRERKRSGEPFLVHCRAGRGRTGVALAMYLMMFNEMTASEAIHFVRSRRHGSIETMCQEKFVKDFEKLLLDEASE